MPDRLLCQLLDFMQPNNGHNEISADLSMFRRRRRHYVDVVIMVNGYSSLITLHTQLLFFNESHFDKVAITRYKFFNRANSMKIKA